MAKPALGAQLYTVREFCKTIDDIEKTLEKVREIGYEHIQVSGFGPVDPKDVAKLFEKTGVKCCATHMGWNEFVDKTDEMVEVHQMWNCKHPAIGGLFKGYEGAEGLKKFIDEMPPVLEKLAAASMDFSYHNHNHELIRIGEPTWLEALYAQTDPKHLKAEIDVYWIQAGGGDPAQWVRMLGKRQPLLHLKDMTMSAGREQRFAEIGEGNMNFKTILDAAEEVDVEYALVEQDQCYGRDPFESLAISYRNLKAMGYE
ncbi:sugar phosphate isomerase/epimerase [bacterium]|nr:sugar phosphate isomerase/epimerase [bacterium]